MSHEWSFYSVHHYFHTMQKPILPLHTFTTPNLNKSIKSESINTGSIVVITQNRFSVEKYHGYDIKFTVAECFMVKQQTILSFITSRV